MGSLSASKQVPTKATAIENMNEAQIDIEIRRRNRSLGLAQSAMARYGTPSQYQQAMLASFPLGAGGSGWTQARIDQRNRDIVQSVENARKFTEAYDRAQSLQRQIENLQNAKKDIAGTGKT